MTIRWRNRFILMVVSASLSGLPGFGAFAQSLEATLAWAYERNPHLAAARANLRATDEQLPQAKANFWRPSITLNAEEGRSHITQRDREVAAGVGSTTDKTTTDATDRKFGYDVTLSIYRGGQTVAAIREARAEITRAEADYLITEQQILKEVVTAYTDVVLYRTLVNIVGENVNGLRDLEKELIEMVAAQQRTAIDLAQLRDSLAQAEAQLAQTIGQRGVAHSRFQAVVNAVPQKLNRWPKFSNLPASREAALSLAQARNPTLRAAESRIRTSEARLRGLTGVLLPEVSLFHSYTHERDKSRYTGNAGAYDEIDSENTWRYGVRMTMPLYEGGGNHSRVRAAKQNLFGARMTLQAAELAVANQVNSAWEQLISAQQVAAINRKRLVESRKAKEGVAYLLRRGSTTMREFLDVRENYLNAMTAIEQAEREVVLVSADLYASTGGLTAKVLALPVDYQDPEAYRNRVEDQFFGLGD